MSAPTATVCQLLHSLDVGGAEMLAYRMALGMSGRYRFVFACLDGLGTLGERLRDDGFPVELLGRRGGLDFGCARRLGQFLRRERVDVIHAHQYTPFFYAILSGVLRRRPPIVFTEHGRFFPDFPRRKRIFFNRLMLRRRDRVLGVGLSVRRALIDNEGIRPDRADVIYNGIDLSRFQNPTADRREVRHSLHLGEDDLVLIHVARLDHLKDHATAIRTLQRVASQRLDAKLLIVGEGPELATIEKEIAKRGVSDHVRILGLRGDVPELLGAADVLILTSISEGIPLTLIEGMAAGLPVVSTDVGGVCEIVIPGETGLVAPSGDDAVLAEAVLRLAGDRELSLRMGTAGRQQAESLFSETAMHQAYGKLYDEMLGR